MTDLENKKKLDESLQYFDDFLNIVLTTNIEGVKTLDVVKNYNVIRNEVAKLYVDLDV